MHTHAYLAESPRCAVANVLDCNILVSEFELQSYYSIHVRINILGKAQTLFSPYSCSSPRMALALNGPSNHTCIYIYVFTHTHTHIYIYIYCKEKNGLSVVRN